MIDEEGKEPPLLHTYTHTQRERIHTSMTNKKPLILGTGEITETSFSPSLRARPEMCAYIHVPGGGVAVLGWQIKREHQHCAYVLALQPLHLTSFCHNVFKT